ncbi:purine-binding chemotaxis protein CheW [Wenzhouxiangella sp. AB-CW3]|uniref:chemotaxis protein CheW n=1 Tax=Wenzhouxiangella sp. AB-CW3 TaxID=2771012 RepID=UPI00168B8F23|nr:chemotaxis protein CheW [Wenzhouxiangella sp. AB-CW3]QOC21176.1 purine-binding chemotaxis protein CheW [Wenzhouxiangella sp. AB-CW3]
MTHSSSSAQPTDPTARQAQAEQDRQFLTFRLDNELYGFGILHVREILEYSRPTRMPMMPEFVQGVISLRGEVVPVINLARRFGLPESEVTKRTCVVVIEISRGQLKQDLGVMVDSVSEVVEIPPEQIRRAPEFGARIGPDFVRGMGKVDDQFVILLAEERVLSMDELAQVSEATEQVAEEHSPADQEDTGSGQ